MEKTVFISFPIEELKGIIKDCLTDSFENSKIQGSETDVLMTITETSAFIHLSVQTIYGLVSKRKIPFCKKSKRLYFSKQDIVKWLKQSREKTEEEILEDVDKNFFKNTRKK